MKNRKIIQVNNHQSSNLFFLFFCCFECCHFGFVLLLLFNRSIDRTVLVVRLINPEGWIEDSSIQSHRDEEEHQLIVHPIIEEYLLESTNVSYRCRIFEDSPTHLWLSAEDWFGAFLVWHCVNHQRSVFLDVVEKNPCVSHLLINQELQMKTLTTHL